MSERLFSTETERTHVEVHRYPNGISGLQGQHGPEHQIWIHVGGMDGYEGATIEIDEARKLYSHLGAAIIFAERELNKRG